PVGTVHAGCGGDPRRGRLDRWRSPSAPPRGHAFPGPVPLLRETPGAGLASRSPARCLARPPHPRGGGVADREVQTVKVVLLVGGFDRTRLRPLTRDGIRADPRSTSEPGTR